MNETQINNTSVAASINVFVISSMKHVLKRIDFQAPDNYEDAINATEESQMTTLVGGRFLTMTNNYLDLQRTSFSPTLSSIQCQSKEYENITANAKQGNPTHC